MAPPRRLIAFAVSALLSPAWLCQGTGIPLSALQLQPNIRHVLHTAGATPVGLAENAFAEQNFKHAEASVLFRGPTGWGSYRAHIILAGVAVLLAQSALIALLMLQIRRRKRSEQTVRRLTRRLIHAGEEERRHLARELHDDIGQRLSLISVGLGSLNRGSAANRQDEDQKIEQSLDELQTLISDVHGLSHRLHSSKLEHLGLRDALRELCQQIAKHHDDLQLGLQMSEIGADLDREVSLCFYRVAQEALSNVVRHSSSSRATVHLAASRGMLRLQVEDDGAGFDPSKTPAGLGMVTMEERLRSVKGRLSVTSKPGEGTVVTAQVSLTRLRHEKSREAKRLAKVASCPKAFSDKQA
jgi:signal transduction histidine kinase